MSAIATRAYDLVVDRLIAAGCDGKGSSWTCPAHEDNIPSLSIKEGDGKALVHCHAGCDLDDVLAALDLGTVDLFDEPRTNGHSDRPVAVSRYPYTDEGGELLFHVVRYRPKGFTQQPANGRRGPGCMDGVRRVLYRLPEVVSAVQGKTGIVWICEGEKDVDAVAAATPPGDAATTMPGGVGKWRAEYTKALAGHPCVIVADRDEPGIRHALAVAAELREAGCHVDLLQPRAGKDVAEHLGTGLTLDDLDPLDESQYARNADNSISALTRANGYARNVAPDTQEVPAPTSCVNGSDDERRETPAQTLSASNAFNAYVDDGPPWPDLDPDALHGPAGLALDVLGPHTEADPAAVLVTLLAAWGALVGPNVYAKAGHVHHPPRLSTVIVGDTAKARKGTSWGAARQPLDHAALQFMADRVLGGFGSGEAVVDEVRDPQPHEDEEKADPGADDKRLIVYEPEFARVLKVCQRETSILSAVLRDAWDGTRLQTRARSKKAVATGHHIAVVGHITAPELRRNLVETEIAGGFANRLLWICARRSKRLPFGGEPDDRDLADLGKLLASRADQVRDFGRIRFDDAGSEMWRSLYDDMADDDPGGMLGAITARPEPQTLRLAVTYALLDGKRTIGVDHIRAGWAIWQYSRASATFIWGDAIGDEIADTLLRAIRKAGPDGLDATAQRSVFSNNVKANRLAAARDDLERRGLIQTDTVPPEGGKGRHRTVSRATRPGAKP